MMRPRTSQQFVANRSILLFHALMEPMSLARRPAAMGRSVRVLTKDAWTVLARRGAWTVLVPRPRRAQRVAAALMAAVCVLCMAAPASAVARTSREPVARTSKERKVEGSITVTLTPPSEGLPVTNKITILLPPGFRDAGARLPSCSPAILEAKGPLACPKSSIVGNGTALGYTILGGQFVPENLTLALVNGPGGDLLTWVTGKQPISIEVVVPGVITTPSGYGEELSFTIPHGLLEPLPGAPGWLQTMTAKLSGESGWLRTTSCPEHPWALGGSLGFTNGQTIAFQATVKCLK